MAVRFGFGITSLPLLGYGVSLFYKQCHVISQITRCYVLCYKKYNHGIRRGIALFDDFPFECQRLLNIKYLHSVHSVHYKSDSSQ